MRDEMGYGMVTAIVKGCAVYTLVVAAIAAAIVGVAMLVIRGMQ